MSALRVWLTGGGGFIGRNLREASHPDICWLAPTSGELDVRDDAAVRRWAAAHGPFDVVVHSATHNATALSHRPAHEILDANVRMYEALLSAQRHWGRMIVFGSGAGYDRRYAPPLVAEDFLGQHVPADPYGLSKLMIARHALTDPCITELRVFGCYGPHEDWRLRFISNAICRALHGLPITLRQDVRFHYLWVGDLVRVVQRVLFERPAALPYNVVPERPVSLSSLAELCRQATGTSVPISVLQEGFGRDYTADGGALRAALPGLRFTPLREGVGQLASWYRARLDQIPQQSLLLDPR